MKLLAVIVLYKLQPSDSCSLRSLLQAKRSLSGTSTELGILLWDNTPQGQEISGLPADTHYVAAPDNPGLTPAYNYGLALAEEAGYEWILTLDQDTVLPSDFLTVVTSQIEQLKDKTGIAAIVPRVISNDRQISPFRFAMGAIPRMVPPVFVGISSEATYAVNSAAVLRVSSLRGVGGYNLLFPLDISDIDLFHRLSLAHMSVYVAGNLIVNHDFSLLNKQAKMSPQRYRNLLRDECAFWDTHMGRAGRLERLLRLVARAVKDARRPGSSDFQKLTWGEILRRLSKRRRARIEEWRAIASSRSLRTAYSFEEAHRRC